MKLKAESTESNVGSLFIKKRKFRDDDFKIKSCLSSQFNNFFDHNSYINKKKVCLKKCGTLIKSNQAISIFNETCCFKKEGVL